MDVTTGDIAAYSLICTEEQQPVIENNKILLRNNLGM